MERILEPELMADPEQVEAYANADFSQPHNDFIERIQRFVNHSGFAGNALDLGCGSGDISRRFAKVFPLCRVDAIDGSQPMIKQAKRIVDLETINRLHYFHGKLPHETLPQTRYEIIFSNSLLHHLFDPGVLWRTVKKYAGSGTKICIMDLLRPESPETAKTLVLAYAENEPPILQRDFYNSLLAAFTLTEISQQLKQEALDFTFEQISDRHVFISGIMP